MLAGVLLPFSYVVYSVVTGGHLMCIVSNLIVYYVHAALLLLNSVLHGHCRQVLIILKVLLCPNHWLICCSALMHVENKVIMA